MTPPGITSENIILRIIGKEKELLERIIRNFKSILCSSLGIQCNNCIKHEVNNECESINLASQDELRSVSDNINLNHTKCTDPLSATIWIMDIMKITDTMKI